jgi:hypothetical protein
LCKVKESLRNSFVNASGRATFDLRQSIDMPLLRVEVRAMRKLLLLPVLATWLMVPADAAAALKFSYERTKAGGKPQANAFIIESRRIRMDGIPTGQGGPPGQPGGSTEDAVVIDGDAKKMLMIYPASKSYREMTSADFQNMKQQLAQARTQMAAQLKNMPPEQRKMMEKMMPGGATDAPALKYESLGKKKKIAGFACEMYRVSIAGRVTSESCMAPWSGGLITRAETDQFMKLSEDLKQIFDMGMAVPSLDFSKIPGMPIEETHFGADGKTVEWTNTLKSITRGAVPATLFQVPAGFSKQAMPTGPGGPPASGRRPRR